MPEKRHGYVGPILLILLGVVLLLSRLNIWSISWSGLLRLWPVLLILFGLDMILRRSRAGGVVLLLVAIGVIVFAATMEPAQRESRTSQRHVYSASGIERAEVNLEVGAAAVQVDALGDSGNLIEAVVLYDDRTTQVDFRGSADGDQAEIRLKSRTQRVMWLPFDNAASEQWTVKLNPSIPIALDIDAGVSDAILNLADLSLTRLEINAGVGAVTVALPRRGRYEAILDGGVGALTLHVPERLDARIRIDGGLGSVEVDKRFVPDGRYYVTEGYARADERVDIDIDGGVGAIRVR